MEIININDYKDYKKTTFAEYAEAKNTVAIAFTTAIKEGKLKEALKHACTYIQLDRLEQKRSFSGGRYDYDSQNKKRS